MMPAGVHLAGGHHLGCLPQSAASGPLGWHHLWIDRTTVRLHTPAPHTRSRRTAARPGRGQVPSGSSHRAVARSLRPGASVCDAGAAGANLTGATVGAIDPATGTVTLSAATRTVTITMRSAV